MEEDKKLETIKANYKEKVKGKLQKYGILQIKTIDFCADTNINEDESAREGEKIIKIMMDK